MKKKFFFFIFLMFPCFVHADIAWPVLTKDQACLAKDGASMNRLQIFLNGKKSDILYFFKDNRSLYYIVPMFPYSEVSQWITNQYMAALFLYRYDCSEKKAYLLSNQNLKKLLSYNTVFTPASPFDSSMKKDFNYGQIIWIQGSKIFFLIGITQTGVSGAYAFDATNKSFSNQIYIDKNWSLENDKHSSEIYGNNGNWNGVDIYYKDKKVFHFASCKWWWTNGQKDVDDFCWANIRINSISHEGLIIDLSYSYPWSPLESGDYLLSTNGSINKLTK